MAKFIDTPTHCKEPAQGGEVEYIPENKQKAEKKCISIEVMCENYENWVKAKMFYVILIRSQVSNVYLPML